MVKGNNVLANVHFRKTGLFMSKRNVYGESLIKPWLNQAGRKKSRRVARQKKAAAIAPRPTSTLRPVVHPPTQRYNSKLRVGRGFTLAELKEAKISPKLAKTIGICVDHRRRNRCTESLAENATRLKTYKSKLMIFPKGSKPKKGDSTRAELEAVPQNTTKYVIPIPAKTFEAPRAIKADEKEASAYKLLKKQRTKKHYLGSILKKQQGEAKEE
eukprot:gnl/MRDRNA2_/MRDRNA2_30535_c0_seq1.p1 gnl/MRDRNA2_/MRDRNA2_30535_c0~~gnl/MRDRNA2_/MRDRNA2_30535_c0_seq1.p1  ORF type:complete len:214 (-),score=50.16 gnl/MRDRNA2_/MRDRNA2_30535_c0_seq1:11-652(-)